MTERHGQPPRGLEGTARSRLASGRFGRLFRALPPATFGPTDADSDDNLKSLGQAMSAKPDPLKDGKDDEESGIPSLYTYFGQFVDHDLTFDPMSSLQKQNDPGALVDYRTPAFDLDNVYGRGPEDQPYMYDRRNPGRFVLGPLLRKGNAARDLPRAANERAIIGDPRNDENTIVSQFQALFLEFHNRMAEDHPELSMPDLQQLVRFHYQYVVLNDFLPKVVDAAVLDSLKAHGQYDQDKLKFFKWHNEPFIPVEFSAAAYRFGHSMVRPAYRLNDDVILPIFPSPEQGLLDGLTGFETLKENRGLDWGRFIDVDVRRYDGDAAVKKRRLQFAYQIDTSIVNPLTMLPPVVTGGPPPSLPYRNLKRGWRLGLPSGQQVARAMGAEVLADERIFIGKATGKRGDAVSITSPKLGLKAGVFENNCPLWTYILAEAMHHKNSQRTPTIPKQTIRTSQLGPVGGRIVAEVFLGLMFGDPSSLLRRDATWHPPGRKSGYALKDLVLYGLGK